MPSDTSTYGRVLKAGSVELRRPDPHAVPVQQRIAEAEQEAYRTGYEDGYTAGALEAGATLADAGERLRRDVLAAVAAHRTAVDAARSADAERLVELALAVAEWAVRRELSTVPDAFYARLEEILADRDRHERVEIVTSPALVERTRGWLDDADIRVVAADDLADGEARVVIGDSTVFATFADAFERARAELDTFHTEQYVPGHDTRPAADDALDAEFDTEFDTGLGEDVEDEVEVLYDAGLELDR